MDASLVEGAGGSDEEQQAFVGPSAAPRLRRFGSTRKVWAGGVFASVAALLVIAALITGRSPVQGRSQSSDGATVELASAADEKGCHTAVKGEHCFVDVQWAIDIGIKGHPDWYSEPCPHLKPSSSFEEFQACVFRINQTSCPPPCNPKGAKDDAEEASTAKTTSSTPTPTTPAVEHTDPCHIAQQGEQCFVSVVTAMLATKKPSGLPKDPTFEDFQVALHKEDPDDSSCPRPCSSCRIATGGSACFNQVMYAMETGIKKTPELYRGLTTDSSFSEVQAHLHKDGKGSCTLPCSSLDPAEVRQDDLAKAKKALQLAKKVEEEEAEEEAEEEEEPEEQTKKTEKKVEERMEKDKEDAKKSDQHEESKPKKERHPHAPTCHTAVKGDKCYEDVVYGIQKGIYDHPSWYPGLTAASSFEDFQKILAKNPDLDCHEPCPCHTALPGESCLDNIDWVRSKGIAKHPSWYPGLTPRSRMEEIQSRLHEDTNTTCQRPCTPKIWGSPSLFCFSVFRSQGYELELVQSQLEKRVGIFACDEFAVLSDKTLHVAGDVKTLMIPPCEAVGVSKDGTAANTLVFMQAWQVIKGDGRYANHDWIIKADPDAVVLVDRLRTHLRPHTGKNIYMKNCMKWTGIGWPMMFGSLEAFTREAMDNYFAGAEKCKTVLQWHAWGEDLFMGQCLKLLGTGHEFDGTLIGDNVCKGANCADGMAASYHPFKSAESWFKCFNQATGR